MKRYRWVLFDADHTLFDFDKASEEALAEVLQLNGQHWEEGMFEDYRQINAQCWKEYETGMINRDTLVYERFRRYFQLRQLDLDPVVSQKQYLVRLGAKPYLMPGAAEPANILLAKLIIERQKKRIITKMNYKQPIITDKDFQDLTF